MSNSNQEFKLERYKYILQQLHSLNENIHKYLIVFQTLVTAVIGGAVTIFVSWKNLKLEGEVARISIHGLLYLLLIISLFVIISVIAGLLSWLDYRKEEVKLLDAAIKPGFRNKPKIGNFWRWYETYLIIFILFSSILIYTYIDNELLPLIK